MFSSLFKSAVQLRNALYTLGALKSHDLGAPVISVGNITVGGTGKTPLVAAVASMLIDEGEKVCILTRGYGRKSPTERVVVSDGEKTLVDSEEGGDEPRELSERLLGRAVIIADPDRVSAGRFATDNFAPTVFILDDGFQHRRVRRDLDIVCVDATDPFGGGRALPFGRLREPVRNIARAHLIVITRANLIGAVALESIKEELASFAPESSIVTSVNEITGYRDVASDTPIDNLKGKVFAFCGIGNPENFFRQLESQNVELVGKHSFRDHKRYSKSDARSICTLAEEHGAETLVTTAKDAVKLRHLDFSLPCFSTDLTSHFEPKEKLRQAVLSAVSR